MQLLWCMRERTNFDRGVLSLFLCLRKNYSEMKRNGQGQIKTCRRKQHVKTDGMKGISNLFCGIFAVGGNYNLTRDTGIDTKNISLDQMRADYHAMEKKKAELQKSYRTAEKEISEMEQKLQTLNQYLNKQPSQKQPEEEKKTTSRHSL